MANRRIANISAALVASVLVAAPAFALTPVVQVVSFVPGSPTTPHDTYAGKNITLKGTSSVAGPSIQAVWDFGDGSPTVTISPVSDRFDVEAHHTYAGSVGQIWSATLTITDTSSGGGTGTATYFVAMRDTTQQAQVNVAIDEGLWFLHKTMHRYTSGLINYGDWQSGCNYSSDACDGYYGATATNLQAFEVNGYLESGSPNEPYTDDVARGLKSVFAWITTGAISSHNVPGPLPPLCSTTTCSINPDGDGNGYAAYVNQGNAFYQGGMFIDAIVASQTPNVLTSTGPSASGSNPGVINRTYKAIVQDMVDGYFNCQYASTAGGGWRYNCGDFPDNSACQWAAIGIIAGARAFGVTVPQIALLWNQKWLDYSYAQFASPSTEGAFGYTQANYFPWGPYATTPSGLVQLAMNGIGRGDTRWDHAESFIRDNFNNIGAGYNSNNSLKDYYYGLFSFTKSMLLHNTTGSLTGALSPITNLQSLTSGVTPLDWYGDATYGIAPLLVSEQLASGEWLDTLQVNSGDQQRFSTGFAIIMLRKQVFVSCVSNLHGISKASGAVPARVTLLWSAQSAADFYTVLRGTTSGGPYTTLGTTQNIYYLDQTGLTDKNTYYYVIQPGTKGGGEVCQSNEAAIYVP